MNKINISISVIISLFVVTIFNGCVKGDFDKPTIKIPTVDFAANMTIAELNTFYSDSMQSAFGLINKDIIIKGIVISSDFTGNIYKKIYIQDETGGMDIELDPAPQSVPYFYNAYKLGQRVYIKCKGMYMGNYGGVPELGYIYNGGIGRMPYSMFSSHLFLDSFPGHPPIPRVVTIPSFSNSMISTLVQIDSVHFATADVGLPFSLSTATTNRTVEDNNGNSFIIRTSSKATFAYKLVPSGTGKVVGILGNFNGTWQLYIRDLNDVIGFIQ